jgi:hypothetical protein
MEANNSSDFKQQGNLSEFEDKKTSEKDYKSMYRLIIGGVLIGVGIITDSTIGYIMIAWGIIRIISVLIKK